VVLDEVNNKILIYPSKFENPEESETFVLTLEAKTVGNVTKTYHMVVELLSSVINPTYVMKEP
jgi:hypothetical protein